MTNDELTAIADRVTAPTSMGYHFTHYKPDVLALMKALLAERQRADKLQERLDYIESAAQDRDLNS